MKRLLLSLLTVAALLPFSLCGMEKEKPIRIREGMGGIFTATADKNADKLMQAFIERKPISEIINLLKSTPNININSHVILQGDFWVELDNPINLADKEIYTILRCALERCNPNNEEDVELVELILKQGASLKQQEYKEGIWKQYLCYAILKAEENNKNLSIVKLLIDHGADVNFRFTNEKGFGNSALHIALDYFYRDEDIPCIDYLLEAGADTNALDITGDSPLAKLAYKADLTDRFGKKKTKLCEHMVEKLLEHGADINKKQMIYVYDKNSCIETNNYDLLKPLMPNLDDIIKKVEDKKKHTIAGDFKCAAEKNKHANQPIIVSGREFNLNEEILSARCSKLRELNFPAKAFLHAPLVTRNINVSRIAALNFEEKETNQENNQEVD